MSYLSQGYILWSMPKVKMTVWGYRCERCNHEWLPNKQGQPPPKVCPACKSPYWDTPRKAPKVQKA